MAVAGRPYGLQALPNEPAVEVTRWFDATRSDVFEVWTSEGHLGRLWGPRGMSVRHCEVDLRVGGAYGFQADCPDGSRFELTGRIVELDIPTRLVTSYSVGSDPASEVVEVTTFEDASGGTLVRIVSLHRSCAARDARLADGTAREAMAEQFASLDEVLSRPAGG